MMGRQPKVQNKLFYTAINLEQRFRKNHILREVKRNIDFIYNEVKDKYGINGNESVAPSKGFPHGDTAAFAVRKKQADLLPQIVFWSTPNSRGFIFSV